MKPATPFVKWIGGKRSILRQLKRYFPNQFTTYYEPFVGGGAVFFALGHQNAVISDVNFELITAYRVIQDNVEALIALLNEHKKNHCEHYFYHIRAHQTLSDPVAVAARFIYLNKTCYNGLYRVNKKNEFNAPLGRYKNPAIVDADNLRQCHQYLKHTIIRHQSYDSIAPQADDFVYFDPPYHTTFLGYNPVAFDESNQIALRNFCDELRRKNIKFAVSNADTDFIRYHYRHYTIVSIVAPRFVNCKAANRTGGKELLILNTV